MGNHEQKKKSREVAQSFTSKEEKKTNVLTLSTHTHATDVRALQYGGQRERLLPQPPLGCPHILCFPFPPPSTLHLSFIDLLTAVK